jgi:ABC-type branched-subunit amino acid transport system ATPase component
MGRETAAAHRPRMRGAMATRPRTITTLIGGSGAGTSTLVRAIHGSCRSFSGRIVFAGDAVEGLQPWRQITRGVGLVPQGRCNFPCMTVAENLKMGCHTAASARHKPGGALLISDRAQVMERGSARRSTRSPRLPQRQRRADGGIGGGRGRGWRAMSSAPPSPIARRDEPRRAPELG